MSYFKKNIFIVTPHPAMDYLFWLKENRYQISYGGKGLNVQRALNCLGVQSTHLSLMSEGLRGNTTVYEGQHQKRLPGIGKPLRAKDILSFKKSYLSSMKKADLILLCGSAPRNHHYLFPWMLTQAARERIPIWLDTSEPTLSLCLKKHPQFITPNLDEFKELLHITRHSRRVLVAGLRQLVRQGISLIALTLGNQGAMLCRDHQIWYANAPQIKPVSTLGCGDAFLAGLCFAWMQQKRDGEMLAEATALASASALSPIPGDIHKKKYQVMLRDIHIQHIH